MSITPVESENRNEAFLMRHIDSEGKPDEQSAWSAVGVSELEEQLYELLLEHPGVRVIDLTAFVELSRSKLHSILSSLEAKGLVTHSPERSRRYFPTPPDVAVEALIVKQQEALQHVRLAASRLQEKANVLRSLDHTNEQVIEIITGRDAQRRIFNQIQSAARDEVIGFDRPPYLIADSGVNETELQMLVRGVRCRGVYDRSALELPGAAQRLRSCMDAGEESRVIGGVPLKLIGADHRVAMLPLDLENLNGAALLVRTSSLLDALYELFEVVWDKAAPFSILSSGTVGLGSHIPDFYADVEHLIPLLAAGLNDKLIAAQLGISHRTLDRRIKALMMNLEARTRFQAGWLAALQFSPDKASYRS